MQRVDLEPAYVLHARSYRETSLLLEVFTHDHGRLGLVARGARRPRSAFRGLLNPFQPLRISWSGRGELQTLRVAEVGGPVRALTDQRVLSGFYVNELLMRLLQRSDPHQDLFLHYVTVLESLQNVADFEPALRIFELRLLDELGYSLNLNDDAHAGTPLESEHLYEVDAEQGAVSATGRDADNVYDGATLRAIHREDFSDERVRRAAKRLLRDVLNFHLGDRGLQTRRIAAAMRREPHGGA